MQSKINNSEKETCINNFIREILAGKQELSDFEIASRAKSLEMNWLRPPFVVVNIAPDYSSIEYRYKDIKILEIEKYVKRWLLHKNIKCCCITNSYNNICILISVLLSDLNNSLIDEVFIELHEIVYYRHHLESFIGIGSVVDSYQKISTSASDAHEMLGFKYQYSNKGVINIANLVKFQCSTSLENRIVFDRVIGCFQDGNLGKMSIRLDELVEQVRNRPNASKTNIKRTMVEIIVQILHVASNANVDVDMILEEKDPYRWIMKQNHTEIITEWIMEVSSKLLVCMNEQKEFDEKKVIQQAKNYIEEYLADAKLGLLNVSNKIGLSSSYFSQLFKKEVGIGVNAYMVQSRIDRAKELLKDTNLKCSDIAIQTGFSSSGYFVQVFKKNVGITPGQFRKVIRSEKN